MKKSNLTFLEGFLGTDARRAERNTHKSFDWDKAANIIKEKIKQHPDLKAEAGLQNDWDYTGGVIFEEGKPTNEDYTYLKSNWAIPTMILSWDGDEQEEIECYTTEGRFDSESKWDETSLAILGIDM